MYTAIPIYKEEVIALFKGEILSELQIQGRLKKGKDQYFIRMLDGTIMDSINTKCFAKYANDAQAYTGAAFKNCSKITIDEDDNVALIATRNIKANEEIFCGYGKAYWKKHG